MIIIKISGGLGNQLFQYSFGRNLSVELGTQLKFHDQSKCNYPFFTSRSFGLDHFNIRFTPATREEIRKFKYFDNGFCARLERKSVQKLPFLNRRYIVQNLNTNQIFKPNFIDNCYYDGYWQSEKYFKSIESIIRNDLNFKASLSKQNLAYLEYISKEESISIHIRRGDYLSVKAHKKIFSECSIDYYNRAIEIFMSKTRDARFLIFSDDIHWAKENFKGNQFRFVDSNPDSPELDMFLMSQCKNNIIANSTFSWWGAWLNSNPTKLVIAPKNWYVGSLNEAINDLVPVSWLKI